MARKHKAAHKRAKQEDQPVEPTPIPGYPNSPDDQSAPADPVVWQAPEFIAHAKDGSWYFGLTAAAAILTVLMFFITHDFLSCAVVVVGAALLGVYAAREPRELEYSIGHSGFAIGEKEYGFFEFRSFSLMGGEPLASIDFMPLRRFSPIITLYYPEEHEKAIVDILKGSLPYQQRKPDLVDRFMRQIRF